MTDDLLKCPTCGRVGDDLGACGRPLTCPIVNGQVADKVDPNKDVLLRCGPCDFTRVLAVTRIMHNKNPDLDVQCPRGDGCACVVVHPKADQGGPRGKGK